MKQIEELSEEFEALSKDIEKAISMCLSVSDQVVEQEMKFANLRDQIIRDNDPKDLGSNEAQRAAKINELCAKEITTLQYWQKELRGWKSTLEIVLARKSNLKYQLECLKLAQELKG